MNRVIAEKTDEQKLEECGLKLKKIVSLIKKENCGNKEIKDTKFFLECHKILLERVYPENEMDVDSIPLIYLN